MTDSKSVKFCVFCEGKNVKATKKSLYCPTCKGNNPEFKVSLNATPEEVEHLYKHNMVYCYCCGEELEREEGKVMCVDGCELINLQVDDIQNNEGILDISCRNAHVYYVKRKPHIVIPYGSNMCTEYYLVCTLMIVICEAEIMF